MPSPPSPEAIPETVARESTPRGDVTLRRRLVPGEPAVYELIVNGAFVMDTVETRTERLLARAGTPVDSSPSRVVVGGLGLGFTLRELLADERIQHIDVVELESCIVSWIRAGLVPPTRGVLADARVETHVADIRYWIPAQPSASVDSVLLDVDNGPDFLVHQANAEVYEASFARELHRVLRPGGILVVWSAARSRALRRVLERTFSACQELHELVHRDGKLIDYYLYVATRD
jgi:spermidine synthase